MERPRVIGHARRLLEKAREVLLERAVRLLVRGHPTNASGNNMSQR
ncbi:MAG: hypothetical protein ACOZNI_26055 [Myxococcota bacterium]